MYISNKELDSAQVKSDLKQLFEKGYRSVAIVLVHSYTFPQHELLVAEIASTLR